MNGVLAIYAALMVWAVLGVVALRQRRYGPFLAWGIGLLLILNVRYFLEGAPAGIAFFIGIYDVLDNLGLATGEVPAAMSTCPDNACSVWADVYAAHPAWGVAFYDRFLNGPQLRRNLLYGHIAFNTLAFLLMHLQLLRTGEGKYRRLHRVAGRLGFAAVTISVFCACWLASEHGSVDRYGGTLSMYGFWFMSACVWIPAVLGVVSIRNGDVASHRKWMVRYAGAMWGAFWVFRVMLFILDPLLRDVDTAAIQICIWFSAPIGLAIAEAFRRRARAPDGARAPQTSPVAA